MRRHVKRDVEEDAALLRRYLLDEMSDAEQDLTEKRYLGDEHLFGRLQAAETGLIEDYWRGRLSPAARERFEDRYLASPLQRERAALIRDAIEQESRPAAPSPTPRTADRVGPSARSTWARAAGWIFRIARR